jgi:hypothetical protein
MGTKICFWITVSSVQKIHTATLDVILGEKSTVLNWPHEPFLPWFYLSSLCPDQAPPSILSFRSIYKKGKG